MTRLQADLCLLISALIWGMSYVTDKTGLTQLSPYTFVAARFTLSFLILLPFAWRENQRETARMHRQHLSFVMTCALIFCTAYLLQVQGLKQTTATVTGMITGLCGIMIPLLLTVFWRRRQSNIIWIAVGLSTIGTYLLSSPFGAVSFHFGWGEGLVLAGTIGLALRLIVQGEVVRIWKAPLQLSCLQYGVLALVSLIFALVFEPSTKQELLIGLQNAAWPILYGAILSGGVAYTLLTIAQQYAPAADSGIILSMEGVFAAIGGITFMHDPSTLRLLIGCALVVSAVLLVELLPLIRRRFFNGSI